MCYTGTFKIKKVAVMENGNIGVSGATDYRPRDVTSFELDLKQPRKIKVVNVQDPYYNHRSNRDAFIGGAAHRVVDVITVAAAGFQCELNMAKFPHITAELARRAEVALGKIADQLPDHSPAIVAMTKGVAYHPPKEKVEVREVEGAKKVGVGVKVRV